MPIIPLPNLTPTPDAPSPVLDQVRRPTVDNSAVAAGVQQLANAQAKPLVPDTLAEPYEALGAVGKAISNTGSIIGALAQKREQALTVSQIKAADDATQIHDAYFQDYMATHPDQTDWGAAGNEQRLAIRDNLLANPKLTQAAREELGPRLLRWDAMQRSTVQLASDKTTFGQAKKGYDDSAETAISTQNMPMLNEAYSGGHQLGVYVPGDYPVLLQKFKTEGERQDKQAKANSYDTSQNAAITFAAANGTDLAIKNLDGGMFDPPDRKLDPLENEKLRNSIQAVGRDRTQDAVEKLSDGIAEGSLNSDKAIDSATFDNPHLSPRVIEQAKQALASHDVYKEKVDQQENGKVNFLDLLPKIRNYNRDADPDMSQYFDLRKEAEQRVGTEDSGYLRDVLWEKATRNPPPVKPGKEVKGFANQAISQMFDPANGALPWKTKVPETYGQDAFVNGANHKAGEIVKDEYGNVKIKEAVDPAARDRATQAEWQIKQSLNQWLDTTPSATIEDVKKKLNELKPEGFKSAVLDAAQKRFGATTTPGSVPSDLVSTVKQLEGFNPNAYGDYKQTSIGYGTRGHVGETITEPQADQRLRQELSTAAGNIDTAAQRGGYKLTPGQRNALTSFDFNTGHGAYLLNTAGGNISEVKRRLLEYTKAGGVENPGLVKRRKTEAAMMGL